MLSALFVYTIVVSVSAPGSSGQFYLTTPYTSKEECDKHRVERVEEIRDVLGKLHRGMQITGSKCEVPGEPV
jgi:hypothetical protein